MYTAGAPCAIDRPTSVELRRILARAAAMIVLPNWGPKGGTEARELADAMRRAEIALRAAEVAQ